MYPSYLESYHTGKLSEITDKIFAMLGSCSICPRKCKVNRLKDEKGFCKTGIKPKIYNFMPHHGEEPPISGTKGSGTIFFSYCNMSCIYCQNYVFSQQGEGREATFEELAEYMIKLQNLGCHNINLVTPTHVIPQILKSLNIAIAYGLKIPLVYNTNGYELPEIIKLLSGIIDIYLPDMRYGDTKKAIRYSSAIDYPKYNQDSLKEIYRQVGNAQIDNNTGIIIKGLIIRHLVLPNGISGTKEIMKFIAQELSEDAYISLMSQYLPCYKAIETQEISRRITKKEYEEAEGILQKFNLHNGWIQESNGLEKFAGINIKPMPK